MMNPRPSLKGIQLSIFVISAFLITYEIILLRFFAIQYWYHFAYLIISVALLGFGASGTFIYLFRKTLYDNLSVIYLISPVLLVVSVWINLCLSHVIRFNPLILVWQHTEIINLAFLVFALFVPFFLGAVCIGMGFVAFPHYIHGIYCANLLGSGVGAVLVLLSVFHVSPHRIMVIISFLAVLAVFPAMENTKRKMVLLVSLLLLFPVTFVVVRDVPIAMSPFKDLSHADNLKAAKREYHRYGPLGLVTVVDSPSFHYLSDLSLQCHHTIPVQKGIFSDGNAVGVINKFSDTIDDFAFMECRTASLGHALLTRPNVLIVGGGGGTDVLCARFYDAESISVVEMNGDIVRLLRGRYRQFSGNIYDWRRSHIYVEDGRGYLQRTNRVYDLIRVATHGAISSPVSGVFSLTENYLLTKEAMETCLEHLTPGGMISISCWVENPPRKSIKLLATAIEVLESRGKDPSQSLIMIRSWQTATLLIKNGAVTRGQLDATREFCAKNLFDICYVPGITEGETNRINRMDENYFFTAARQLLSMKRHRFYEEYPFRIEPATDDKPFFSYFFKTDILKHYIATGERILIPFVDWGYVLVWMSCAILVLFSMIFIVAPVTFKGRVSKNAVSVFVYFGSLGLAYMFLEIAFLQQFIRYLYDPVFSATVVVSSFLVYSGAGSWAGEKMWQSQSRRVVWVFPAIVMVGLFYMMADHFLYHLLLRMSLPGRMVICSLMIAPLAVPMGVPFPSGLSRLSETEENVIPWAWGINGFFSVIGASTAVIIAVGCGFRAVIVSALFLYAISGGIFFFWDRGNFPDRFYLSES